MTKPIHELTQSNEIFYLKDFFEQIECLDEKLIPQIIGSIFCTTDFYDVNQENYLSPMTVMLLQKFYYLLKNTMYEGQPEAQKMVVDLLKDWAKEAEVNDETIEKYHRGCDKLKETLDAGFEAKIKEMENMIQIGKHD